MPELARIQAALRGKYDLERPLGEGGMSTVYLARDPRHGRKVAVKVLRADLAATLGHDRFLREIRIAANLSHPHVVPLYDSGEAAGRPDQGILCGQLCEDFGKWFRDRYIPNA